MLYFSLGENTFVEVFDHADAHRRSQSSQPLEPLEEPRDSWLMRYNHFVFKSTGSTPSSRRSPRAA